MEERQQGLLAIISANTIFGLNIPVTKALMEQWMTPMGYTTTRMFFGAILFWLLGTVVKDSKVEKRDLPILIIGGLIGFIGTQFLFSQSLKYTSPVIFSLLMALTPVVVLGLSKLFLNEFVSKIKILGIIISISGAALIILLNATQESAGSNNTLGILFAVLCVCCYAGYLVLTRTISVKYKPITIAKWMFLVSALVALPFSGSSLQNQAIYSENATLQTYGYLIFALLFSTTLAFFLMPFALKRLEASTVSIFMNLQPIVASFVAIIVGQDVLTWDKPVATIMVITGVCLVTMNWKNSKLRMALVKVKS
ncbi:DMT family transporter [Aestuariibaculum sp. YM273]|uniref:DMT family transporter n=1 Tax=Aestuariibaculum sp. YM273 TaxID=3070659 RepID=UPI0027DC1A9F|nr:DMT family transporter [Aestuariibaculum sp. YM273]WMI64829.1 DMT family transporter [Aestuariibaculum sp. YM273]